MPDLPLTLTMKTAADLLARLKTMEIKSSTGKYLVLISLGGLPLQNAVPDFWEDLDDVLVKARERFDATIFKINKDDRGLLIKLNEFNKVRVVPDLKVELLRLIQRYFPDNFGTIDQSRLIRMLDLTIKLSNAIRYLERLNERPEFLENGAAQLRRLHEDDIQQVQLVSKQLGPKGFAKIFIHHQKIAIVQPGHPPKEFMNEYYVAMGALKEHVFPKVELRGAGNLFNQLTVVLDGLLLAAFGELNAGNSKCSINMNVESVFSKDFERLLGDTDDATFSNVVFEFRQSNILQNFEEFQIACDLIRAKNGTIAIDAIFPETIGIVNLARLKTNIAKIFWRSGAEEILPKYKKEINDIQSAGTVVVLARLDDEIGIEVGQNLGISMFQGFHIDKLLED